MMLPSKRQTVWVENSPESLLKLTSRFCLKQLRVFTDKFPCGSLNPMDGLCLPQEIFETMFTVCREEGIDIDDNFIDILRDFGVSTRLEHLALRKCSLSDQGMRSLLGHGLRVISIHKCQWLSTNSLELINDSSSNLVSLHVDPGTIFPHCLSPSQDSWDEVVDENTDEISVYEKRRYILKAPQLRNLCIKNLFVEQGGSYFAVMMTALPSLSHLDLSGLVHSQGLERLAFLLSCPNLVSLILHNVEEVNTSLNTLCQMKKVEHLDISQYDEQDGEFEDPTSFLTELVSSLPALRSLDISGTNLASDYIQPDGQSDGKQCGIPGLAGRIEQPLEFLGLYGTHQEDASWRPHIPARKVAGEASEEQVLLAGWRYHDRPHILECVLNHLHWFLRFKRDACGHLDQMLDITVLAMERYCNSRRIQLFGIINLIHLLNPEIEQLATTTKFNRLVKGRVLNALLDSMRKHCQNEVLLLISCTVLWQFLMLGELPPLYERILVGSNQSFIFHHFRIVFFRISYFLSWSNISGIKSMWDTLFR